MEDLTKTIDNSIRLIDYGKAMLNWATQVNHSSPWLGVLAYLVCILGALVLLFWLLKKGLEFILSFLESWKKAGLPITQTQVQRESIRRRSQFCKAIRSDLDTLNKSENWNDQFFTDLEADIEAQGWYYASRIDALFRRRSRGLRRVKSLIKAIDTSDEPTLLLVGEPGSGKSVALRHLAYQLAERGIKSKATKTPIPLYINLKELPPAPKTGPNADWIRTFVIDNVRRGDADTADYIREHWDEHLKNGLWLFLFDSFDEIPAVMHAPAGNTIVKQYAESIRQFLAGMSDCRGILASREFKGPESLPWQKFRILTLNPKRQDGLIENSFLSKEQKNTLRQHIATSTSNLHHNPLFLSLLCRHLKQENRLPANDHDLLSKHIDRLAEREPEYTQKKYSLSPRQLLSGAMDIAVLFATNENLSLAPTYDQIAEELPPNSATRKNLNSLLAALVDVKIGRTDVQESKHGDRRFTFSHRRYQEALFVRHLATHSNHLTASELLLEQRWREYTVALLQTESSATITPILTKAAELLHDFNQFRTTAQTITAIGPSLTYHIWSEREFHLLDLLQEGLGGRLDEAPSSLTSALDELLSQRWINGDFIDRAMVIQRGRLLPTSSLSTYLSFAVPLGTSLLEDISFKSAIYLRAIPTSLLSWMRQRLSNQLLSSNTRADELRLIALGARAHLDVGAEAILHRGLQLRRWLAPLIYISKKFNPHPFSADAVVLRIQALIIQCNILSIAFFMAYPAPPTLAISAAITALSVGFFFRMTPGYKSANYLETLKNREVRLYFINILGMATAAAVTALAELFNQKFLALFIAGPMALYTFFYGIWRLISGYKDRRRHRHRLDRLSSHGHFGVSLALLADSLEELHDWLLYRRNLILPDNAHSRTLSRILVFGVQHGADLGGPGFPLMTYIYNHERMGTEDKPSRALGAVADLLHQNTV